MNTPTVLALLYIGGVLAVLPVSFQAERGDWRVVRLLIIGWPVMLAAMIVMFVTGQLEERV